MLAIFGFADAVGARIPGYGFFLPSKKVGTRIFCFVKERPDCVSPFPISTKHQMQKIAATPLIHIAASGFKLGLIETDVCQVAPAQVTSQLLWAPAFDNLPTSEVSDSVQDVEPIERVTSTSQSPMGDLRLVGPAAQRPHLADNRGRFPGSPAALMEPS